jgi:hypothetical protein
MPHGGARAAGSCRSRLRFSREADLAKDVGSERGRYAFVDDPRRALEFGAPPFVLQMDEQAAVAAQPYERDAGDHGPDRHPPGEQDLFRRQRRRTDELGDDLGHDGLDRFHDGRVAQGRQCIIR